MFLALECQRHLSLYLRKHMDNILFVSTVLRPSSTGPGAWGGASVTSLAERALEARAFSVFANVGHREGYWDNFTMWQFR